MSTILPPARVRTRNRWILAAVIFAAILPLALYICFYNLGSGSFGVPDESSHVQAIQSMKTTGVWWLPRVGTVRYFNKPPFKMWLTLIPITLLGESNFSYRIIDGLLGVGTTALLVIWGLVLFRSPAVGAIAALTLLGCKAYVFTHGIRSAVQDGMLMFLTTFAMLAGWQFFAGMGVGGDNGETFGRQSIARRYAHWALGIAVGLAVYTKTVAGFLAFVLLGLFALAGGHLPRIWRTRRRQAMIAALLGIGIPATYFLPHVLFTSGAFDIMFGHEIVHRATAGLHNVDKPWFYFIRIFEDRATVPPELLVIGLLTAVIYGVRKRDQRCLFLLIWAAAPVALYSLVPPRLTWYIAPAYPAMALLIAMSLALAARAAVTALRPWWQGTGALSLRGVIAGVYALCGVALIGRHLYLVTKAVNVPKRAIAFDTLSREVRAQRRKVPRLSVIGYEEPRYAFRERAYRNMLRPISKEIADSTELEQLKEPAVVLTAATNLYDAMRRLPITGYRFFPPLEERSDWIAAFTLGEQPALPHFKPLLRRAHFSLREAEFLMGWREPETVSNRGVRRIRGHSAALVVAADWAHHRLTTNLRFHYACASTQESALEIVINGVPSGTISGTDGRFVTEQLELAPGLWQAGRNVITFRRNTLEGEEPMFEWLELELLPNAPAHLPATEENRT